jgi:hypothetical protein
MYLDLYKEARTNGEFRHELRRLISKIRTLEEKKSYSSRAEEEINEAVVQIYRMSKYNAGFLVPYFFPQYPYNTPLTMNARPYSYALMNMQLGGYMVIRASRQIGKSTTFAARQLVHAHILPKYTSMYVAPHPSFLETYANRLQDMYRAFKFQEHNPNYRKNLRYKEWSNGSKIWLVKCLTDSQEARSKSTDELLFDEAQLLDPELLPDIEQTQKASRMPGTIFAGTSTTMESLLEARYQESSQGVWVLRLPGFESHSVGKGWLNCGDENDVIKCISVEGFINPETKHPINVLDGEWLHASQRRMDAGFLGFHIPQVIIPEFVYKPNKWREIVQQYQTYSIKKFMQEVLGIPTEEGQREITVADLKAICDESLTRANMKERAISRQYRKIVSGCDWGGSDYNPAARTKASNTVHVMLGILPNGNIDILKMTQYAGMDYRDIIKRICADHKEFGATAMASDFGVGAAYNMLLRENPAIVPERHLIFAYSGPNSRPIAPPGSGGWFNQYALNRTDSITALYSAIKSKRIRCYNFAEASHHLMEFLNLYRIPTDTQGGAQNFRYVKHGARPDDTLHATNFAFILTEILQNKSYVEDTALREKFNRMLAGEELHSPTSIFGIPGGGVVSG